MQGMFFVHMAPDRSREGVVNVRRGQIIAAIGPGHWLLRFQARGYLINSLVATADLTQYALFDDKREQDAFLAENCPLPQQEALSATPAVPTSQKPDDSGCTASPNPPEPTTICQGD